VYQRRGTPKCPSTACQCAEIFSMYTKIFYIYDVDMGCNLQRI
jgi:hypothetical protein